MKKQGIRCGALGILFVLMIDFADAAESLAQQESLTETDLRSNELFLSRFLILIDI